MSGENFLTCFLSRHKSLFSQQIKNLSMTQSNNYVIIMAGGIGSRFWPMSRKTFPKQFHDVLGRGKSLIQETFDRFVDFIPAENIYVVTNDSYFDLVKQQLPALSDHQILLEPVGRNTAPCIAYACYKISQKNPNANYVVAPADHLIEREDIFKTNIQKGLDAVAKNAIIMTIGITPTRPDTGYGYINYQEDYLDLGYYRVKTFTEKPELPLAKQFVASGDYLWNGGIFLFSTYTIQKAFQEFLPDTADLFTEIASSYYTDAEQAAIKRVYEMCKPISIDYGIMQKADKKEMVYTMPSDLGWSDLGTWGSVHANSEKDEQDNAAHGNILTFDCNDTVIHSSNEKKIIVAKGVEGMIIVDTGDALLICKKEEEQFIKKIVGELKERYGDQYV